MRRLFSASALILVLYTPAVAGTYETVAVYWRGEFALAFAGFQRLAHEGHTLADAYLAVMLSLGQGAEVNLDAADAWILRAARTRPGDVRLLLDYTHAVGNVRDANTPADRQSARRALERMEQGFAERGSAAAQVAVGTRHYLGLGVPQSYINAAIWYSKAAMQGHGEAQGYLGMMHARGHGVPEDQVKAHMWLSLAISGLDDSEMRDRYGDILRRIEFAMTRDQIDFAKRLANDWVASTPAIRSEGSRRE